MARRCALTDKTVLSGNLVSHSNRKTKTRFLPNIVTKTFNSEVLRTTYKLNICASTLRTIDFKGGFDQFLLKTSNPKLSKFGKKIKARIIRASKIVAGA